MNDNDRSVVIPVEALQALFGAQTEQVKILMEGLTRMTEKVCETALKVEEMRLRRIP